MQVFQFVRRGLNCELDVALQGFSSGVLFSSRLLFALLSQPSTRDLAPCVLSGRDGLPGCQRDWHFVPEPLEGSLVLQLCCSHW
ncbi:hypothetical protein GJAV_G00100780 [Gymnothorax javanicus]|nr:hypothetical protein GJAV_G00100780 [Gymnothorax javanicus]